MKRILMGLATAVLLFGADLTGRWDAQVETGAGSGTPTLVLKQSGEELTGTYTGALGEAPLKGTLKGSDFQIEFEVAPQGDKLKVTYKGKLLEDGTLKGTISVPGLGEGTFTAKKH